jgi:hypothetical protein
MRRIVLVLALFSAAALTADEPKKDVKVTKKDVAKMMKETHRGEKAPYTRTAAELKKDTPDWDQIAKDAKAFTEMGAALKSAGLYTSKEQYVNSSAALVKATGDKDKKAANEAFTGLTMSCGSCHYGGARAMLK